MSASKIKKIQDKAKAEKRNLTAAEVRKIKALSSETETASRPRTKKTLKIRFTKSPAGAFRLSDNIGDVVRLPAPFATEIIASGYAELEK